ncbi:ATP-dependent DNA helicase pif1-like [Amphiura filiformis]|uniref:ATP-dependent DNA helicase pif1-like n=1 Tax=Amphiura filiformis TaxID=82378 RepID=UPI003B213024
MIGRIPVISLNAHQSELYFLRMLLHHQPGATSFADLKTVEDKEHATFQAACLKLGLLEDDTEIDKVMEEAAAHKFGNQLRDVFATILIWIRPADPLAFYERHKHQLVEDYLRRDQVKDPTDIIVNELLIYLQDRLEREKLELQRDFGLPMPDANVPDSHMPREIREEINHDVDALQHIDVTNWKKLNAEQREVYDTVITSVDSEQGLLISLDASGGTGKTFVLSTILAHVRSKKGVALATATSGIAATLLPKGRTLHSRLKVPINITEESTCNITPRCATAELIRRCKLLVIDEVSMADRRILEAVNRSMQDIRKNKRTFGGVTVVLAGDWRQILPIVRKGSRSAIINACIKSSPLWSDVKVMKLTRNMRVAMAGGDECDYAKHLLDIGEGKVPVDYKLGKHKIRIKDEFVYHSDSFEHFANFVFDELQHNYKNPEWLTSRAILCPTNDGVDKVNDYLLKKFPGPGRVYKSSDTIEDHKERHQYPEEFLNSLNPSGLPSHVITLKPGAPIILLRISTPSKDIAMAPSM